MRTPEDEKLYNDIITDIVNGLDFLRWCEYRLINDTSLKLRLFRGGLGTYVIGVQQRGDGSLSASIRDDVTHTVVVCNADLSRMLYLQACTAVEKNK